MGLDQGGRGRIQFGRFPGALHSQLLADRVGGSDALAFAVAAAGHAADDGVDLVAGALGVFQSFQQERARAFAHDKAVSADTEGARARGAESADLAEFDKGRCAHVAVDAAGQYRVYFVLGQELNGRLDGGEAAGAGGIGDEVRPTQVEDVGHAARDDVGEFTGHGVFVDGRQGAVHDRVELLHQGHLCRRRQPLKLGRGAQPAGVFGEGDALGGDVVQLAAHSRAQDDAGALGVERPFGVAVVGQRLGGDGNSPLLPLVHGRDDARRQAKALPVELEAAHPAADFAIGLVRRCGVGVVVIGNVPAVGRRLSDTVALADDVFPEGSRVRRVGQFGSHPHDSDSALC